MCVYGYCRISTKQQSIDRQKEAINFLKDKENTLLAERLIDIATNYGKVIPLGFRMIERFLQAGFTNEEIIIKEQHKSKSCGCYFVCLQV